MKNPPDQRGIGGAGTSDDEAVLRVPAAAVEGVNRHTWPGLAAYYRRRKCARVLDRLLADRDPWDYSILLDAAGWPVEDVFREGRYGWTERAVLAVSCGAVADG